jgi:hypothetical protein
MSLPTDSAFPWRTTSHTSMLDVSGFMPHLSAVIGRLIPIFSWLIAVCAAQPLSSTRLSCEVENTAKATLLTAKIRGTDSAVTFRIDWLSGNESPGCFRNHPGKADRLTSTHRIGKTTLARTILVSEIADCILLHIQADQPGAVHFTACFLPANPVKILDRRQMIMTNKGIQAHAWVIPFESDVSDDGKAITLTGDGEALILLNLTPDPAKHPISDTLARLGQKHDPGQTPPNPHLIWQAVSDGVGK